MKHPCTFVMFILANIIATISLQAQTQITSCSTEFIDIGGESSNYLDNENSDWLICPDTLTEYLELEFTHVNIEVALNEGIDSTGCRDLLYIYDGLDDTSPLVGSFCGEESGSGTKSFMKGHTLNVGDKFKPTNVSGCFYIKFESDNEKRLSGWTATVNCCAPTLANGVTDGIDLPLAQNGGRYFNLDIDNSCVRKGELEMFTEFEATGSGCFSSGLSQPNKSFYAFQTNVTGGFVEMMVAPIDSVGTIEMLVYGPVTLDSTGYSGGVINDCVVGEEPWSMFFNAGPNQTYILAIATELPGRTAMNTLSSTEGLGGIILPVTLLDYNIQKRNKNAVISWETSHEVNNAGFEVYRSYDGKSFDNIDWVDSKAGFNNNVTYTYTDTPQNDGNVYYYVRQVDKDGRSQDFDILTVRFDQENKISTYPNPSNGRFTLEASIDSDDNAIYVYNQLGQLKFSSSVVKGQNLDLTQLNSGIYTIQIVNNGSISSHQHIINN